mgnify:FL=1
MRKGIKSLLLIAAAAMTFTSCQKEDKAQVNDGKGTVKVNFTSVADGTKTYFGDRTTDKYPTLWTGDEKVGITYLDTDLDNEGNNVVEVNGKGETTTFSAELAEPSSKEGSIFVFSPWYKGNYTDADAGGFTRYSSTNKNANVVIPTTQVSTPTSCDPKAQLLVAKYDFTNGVANNVDVIFTHATAYGKVTINGVDAKIKTVKIDFGQNVTGTGLYYYTADNEQYGNKAGELKAGNKYNNTYVEIDNSKYPCDKTFWFGIPAISCEGKTVVVTVTDENDKEYTKAITSESKILKFEQGKISSFTVTVAPKSEEKTYTTVDKLRAKGANSTISEQVYMKATVISNNEGGNSTSLKNIVISDGNAGIAVRFKSNANTEWKVGTELEFDLMGASLSAYNGCLQLKNFDNAKAVATGNVNKLAPKTISAADLVTGKYESMYVAIPDVQVVNDDLSKTVGGSSHTSINMEAKTGEKFVMFTASYAVFKEDQVPQGCGTLMGIANINNDTYQVMPTIASDYAGLTGTRFGDAPALEFKTPTFTATTFKEGVEIVNGKIILTYKNASREKIKVEGTASGEAASGVGVATTSDQLGEGDGTIELSVFGTPAKAGAVTFNITVTKAGETEPLYTGSVDATVASASSTETSYTVDFAAQGYKRGDIMTDKNDGNLTFGDYTIVFAKNKGANPPTYYCPETGVTDNTQAAVRMYPQNTMTIKSNKTIVKMVINAYSGNANNPTVTVNTGAYTLNSTTTPGDTEWTGSAKEITFTIGGKKNYRISSIKIYTE